MLAAWRLGRDEPPTGWIVDYLIPIWKWVGVAVVFALIVRALIRLGRR